MRIASVQSRLNVCAASAMALLAALACGGYALSPEFFGARIPFVLVLFGLLALCAFLAISHKVVVLPLRALLQSAQQTSASLSLPGDRGDKPCAFETLLTHVQAIARSAKDDKGLLQGILGGLPMPYLLVDVHERAVRINQPCLDMLEIDGRPEDCLGKTLAEIFYNDPTRKTAVGRSICEGAVFRNLEVTIKGHKGGERHVLANVFPLGNLDKACIGGLCLYIDMTALKEAEALIKHNLDRFSKTSESLEGVVEVATTASGELSARIQRSSLGAREQSQRVADTASAMEEMNATVLEVARNASRASQTSSEASLKAREGLRVVELAVGGIEAVRSHALELRQDMAELGAQAEGIGRILNVISDIADQTNLLALNAAIEAARAGDAGRGFAVVADEVRKLAEKTMTATREVGEAIKGIQDGTRKNMDNVDRSAAAIEKATEQVRDSGGSLQEIVSLVEDASDQVRSIATAAEQQSAASGEINSSIEQVAAISTDTAQAMDEAMRSMGELTEQTQVLRGLIAQMRS